MAKVSAIKDEFIVPVIFEVLNALYENEIAREPDVTFGQERRVTGIVPRVVLEVRAEDIHIPITMLGFRGTCNLEAGDRISAYIEKYCKTATAYAERGFLVEEEISRIEKLSKDRKVLARFHGLPRNISYS